VYITVNKFITVYWWMDHDTRCITVGEHYLY